MPSSLYSDGLAAILGGLDEPAPGPIADASAALLGPPGAASAGRGGGGGGHGHGHGHGRAWGGRGGWGGYYGDGFAVLVGEPVEVVEVVEAPPVVEAPAPVAAAAGGMMGVDEFLRYGQRVNSDVLLVEAAVQRAQAKGLIDGPWWQSFTGFRNGWSQYYAENIQSPPLIPWQSSGSLDEYADQAAQWAKKLIEKTKGAESVPGVQPGGHEKGGGLDLPKLPTMHDLKSPDRGWPRSRSPPWAPSRSPSLARGPPHERSGVGGLARSLHAHGAAEDPRRGRRARLGVGLDFRERARARRRRRDLRGHERFAQQRDQRSNARHAARSRAGVRRDHVSDRGAHGRRAARDAERFPRRDLARRALAARHADARHGGPAEQDAGSRERAFFRRGVRARGGLDARSPGRRDRAQGRADRVARSADRDAARRGRQARGRRAPARASANDREGRGRSDGRTVGEGIGTLPHGDPEHGRRGQVGRRRAIGRAA